MATVSFCKKQSGRGYQFKVKTILSKTNKVVPYFDKTAANKTTALRTKERLLKLFNRAERDEEWADSLVKVDEWIFSNNPKKHKVFVELGVCRSKSLYTLQDVFDHWKLDKVETTIKKRERELRYFVHHFLGLKTPLSDISQRHECSLDKVVVRRVEEEYLKRFARDLQNPDSVYFNLGSKNVSVQYKKNTFINVKGIFSYARQLGSDYISTDIGRDINASFFFNTKKQDQVATKSYISIDDFKDFLDRIPEKGSGAYAKVDKIIYTLGLTCARVIGSRPAEMMLDKWEDIYWENDFPVRFVRHFKKTGNNYIRDENNKRIGTFGRSEVLEIPTLLAHRIMEYRHHLHQLHAKGNPSWKPTGQLFWVGLDNPSNCVPALLKKLNIDWVKPFNTFRASASTDIYDFCDIQTENRYLCHNEEAAKKHYIGSLWNRPERFLGMALKGTATMKDLFDRYNDFLDKGDSFKKSIMYNETPYFIRHVDPARTSV